MFIFICSSLLLIFIITLLPLTINSTIGNPDVKTVESEITSLTQVVNTLQRNYRSNSRSRYSSNHRHSPNPVRQPRPPPNNPMSAGTTGTLEIWHANAHLPAPSRKTIRPAADGGPRAWPASKSPILHH